MPSLPVFSSSYISVKRTIWCRVSQSQVAVVNGPVDDARLLERNEIRIGLPSKGRMAADTLDLLKVLVLLGLILCLVPEKCPKMSSNLFFLL
jgi:hypothetical protein